MENMENNSLATIDLSREMSGDARNTFCSVQGGDRVTKAKIYNAMNNPEHKVGDYINKVINVKDVLVELISLENEETGEVEAAPRVVLIDDKGKAYQAVSAGIFNAVKNAIAIFGVPTWDEPLPCLIKQISVKNGSMLTFDIQM